MAGQDAMSLLRANVETFSTGNLDRFGDTLADDAVYDELATQRTVKGRPEPRLWSRVSLK